MQCKRILNLTSFCLLLWQWWYKVTKGLSVLYFSGYIVFFFFKWNNMMTKEKTSAYFCQLNHIAGWLMNTSFILSYESFELLDRLFSSKNIKFLPQSNNSFELHVLAILCLKKARNVPEVRKYFPPHLQATDCIHWLCLGFTSCPTVLMPCGADPKSDLLMACCHSPRVWLIVPAWPMGARFTTQQMNALREQLQPRYSTQIAGLTHTICKHCPQGSVLMPPQTPAQRWDQSWPA